MTGYFVATLLFSLSLYIAVQSLAPGQTSDALRGTADAVGAIRAPKRRDTA